MNAKKRPSFCLYGVAVASLVLMMLVEVHKITPQEVINRALNPSGHCKIIQGPGKSLFHRNHAFNYAEDAYLHEKLPFQLL